MSDFLGHLAAQDRDALFALGQRRSYPKGGYIFRVGEPGAHVYFLSDEADIRIAKLILRLGARYGRRERGVIHLDIPLTHQEIADMVGTTRQTVTSALSRLKRQGALSIDTHRIQIESEELLAG